MIKVAEIFGPTIQGEGPQAGAKVTFIRVAGCDFKCEWCDSKFAWDTSKAQSYEPEELIKVIVNNCVANNTSHIVITGGNPCIYEELGKVVQELKEKHNFIIDVETQGSIFPYWLDWVDTLVISPKAPSSKQKDVYDTVNDYVHKKEITKEIAIKIPVFDDKDFEFVKKYYNLVDSMRYTKNIKLYLSVGNEDTSEEGDISPRILARYKKLIEDVCDSNMEDVYVLPQIHTLVWGNKQGV